METALSINAMKEGITLQLTLQRRIGTELEKYMKFKREQKKAIVFPNLEGMSARWSWSTIHFFACLSDYLANEITEKL